MNMLRIQVTSDDIAKGVRGDSRGCAVQLALHRAAADAGISCHIRPEDMPLTMLEWIEKYDSGTSVEPIQFDVKIHYGSALPWNRKRP